MAKTQNRFIRIARRATGRLIRKTIGFFSLFLPGYQGTKERYEVAQRYIDRVGARRKFAKNYTFINRQRGTKSLIIIIAGFQPYYWTTLLSNVHKANSAKRDVCICIPLGGSESSKLYQIAEQHNWSLLHLKHDLLAQAQNTAIRLHEHAQFIHKLDEDIVISNHYFDDMEKAFAHQDESEWEPGFLSPTININLATTDDYLKAIGKYEEFYSIFKKEHRASLYYHRSPEVGEYLTRSLLAQGKVSYLLDSCRQQAREFLAAPVRLSVGCVLFTRDYWERLGHFSVGIQDAETAKEEEQMCSYNVLYWVPAVYVSNILVGHLGYYTQKEACKAIFLKHKQEFANDDQYP